jgi:hypothetical protein
MTAEGALEATEVPEEVNGCTPLWFWCTRNGDLSPQISR